MASTSNWLKKRPNNAHLPSDHERIRITSEAIDSFL